MGTGAYEAGGDNFVINPSHNITNVIIEKNGQSDGFSNVPLKLVSSTGNNVLSSFRNGPVRPGVSAKAPVAVPAAVHRPSTASRQRNPTPMSRDPSGSSVSGAAAAKIQPPTKKQRPYTAQHARPASPGIRGKVADAPYKSYANSIRSTGIVITEIDYGSKLKSTSPRQAFSASAATMGRSSINTANISMRGASPAKPRWKA